MYGFHLGDHCTVCSLWGWGCYFHISMETEADQTNPRSQLRIKKLNSESQIFFTDPQRYMFYSQYISRKRAVLCAGARPARSVRCTRAAPLNLHAALFSRCNKFRDDAAIFVHGCNKNIIVAKKYQRGRNKKTKLMMRGSKTKKGL